MSASPAAATADPPAYLGKLRKWMGGISAAGTLLFGSLFVTSYLDPMFVERTAKELIRLEVQSRVQERIDALDERWLAERAGRLIRERQWEIAELKKRLSEGLPKRLSSVLDQMGDKNCACRLIRSVLGPGVLQGRIASAQQVIDHLDGLIRSKYMETATQLTREFRIFTGTNMVVFALLGLAVWRRKRAGMHLVPATAILLVAAGLSAYFYLFSQDWLRTIVFNEYVGLAYVGYLAGVLVLFVDVIFNRGRGTVVLLNLLGAVVGTAAAMIPC